MPMYNIFVIFLPSKILNFFPLHYIELLDHNIKREM